MKKLSLNIFCLFLFVSIYIKAENKVETIVKNKLNIAEKMFLINNDSCIQIAKEALGISKLSSYTKGEVNSREFLGLAYKNFGFNQRAIENFNEALLINEKLGDKSHIAENYRMLGETYRASILYGKSIDYLNRANTIFNSLNDSIGIAKTQNRFASVYFELFNSININNFQKRKLYSDSIYLSINKSNLICSKFKLNIIEVSNYNILGAYYNVINLVDSSLYFFNHALEISKENNFLSEYVETLISKSDLLLHHQRYDEALDCINLASILPVYLNSPGYKRVGLTIKYECYWKKGQFEKALIILDSLTRFEVVLFDKTLKTNSNIIQEHYDEKISAEQLEITNQRIIYSIIFASIILILLMIIIIILRKANKEHKENNSQLKILNNTKDKFFSIIAHDLRNPLGSFKQVTTLLIERYNEISEQDRLDFLDLMKESSKNLYSLLENLLEWSLSQRGTLTYNSQKHDLYLINKEIFDIFKLSADNKNIRLISKVKEDSFAMIDLNLIRTVFRNLISNSIKFTNPDGIIEVGAIKNENNYHVYIKDSGVGMSKTSIEKLFKIDENVSTLGTSQEKGSGLGLIICKEFIEINKGKMWVESEEGIGSKFNFTLPFN